MNLSATFAMQMVEELSAIINQHINLIDKDGTIIASTDKSRIGSCHMGAKRMIDDGLPYLIIESDTEYIGSKKGVNLPIVVDEEIVGIIGITGDRHDVEKYGEIIRKFTEMYIRDDNLKQLKQQEEKIRSRFLENWLINPSYVLEGNFHETATALGVDINIRRRIIMVNFVFNDGADVKKDQHRLDEATRYLRNTLLDNAGCYYLRIGTKLVFLVTDLSDEKLKEKCLKIIDNIQKNYHLDLKMGMDDHAMHYKQIHQAYLQAQKALTSAITIQHQSLVSYKDLNIELFLYEIPGMIRQEFIDKIFKGCSVQEINEAMHILEVLYGNDGSIEKTSAQLFIHKNTLQYKLNKLFETTGHNPRHCHGIPLYYLAMAFYKNRH
jgi:carbohydrate diacid regulator